MSAWNVYSLRTTTGEVGSTLDPVGGSWSIELNKVEDFSITVKKSQLLKRERLWWYPWSGGVLFTRKDSFGYEHPVVAGPITDYGAESLDELELQCSGIRKVFEYRVLDKDLRFTNSTYGEMMWGLVQAGMKEKPGGSLPIVRGVPFEQGEWEMTYYGWNLANNSIDKLLTERSEIQRGPDVMFRPRWVEGKYLQQIEWVMVYGTKLSPLIPQERSPDFDTTAAASDVAEVSVSSTGKDLRHKYWCTGAGEGAGTAIGSAVDLSGVEAGQPFLEAVMSVSDQDKVSELEKKAAGALTGSVQMIDQVTMKVNIASEKNPLGSFFVGDTATVTLRDWVNIPDGTRPMTIIKMNGDLSDMVTLDFQEGSW